MATGEKNYLPISLTIQLNLFMVFSISVGNVSAFTNVVFSQGGRIAPLRSVGSISQAPTLQTIQEEQDRDLQQMRAKVNLMTSKSFFEYVSLPMMK